MTRDCVGGFENRRSRKGSRGSNPFSSAENKLFRAMTRRGGGVGFPLWSTLSTPRIQPRFSQAPDLRCGFRRHRGEGLGHWRHHLAVSAVAREIALRGAHVGVAAPHRDHRDGDAVAVALGDERAPGVVHAGLARPHRDREVCQDGLARGARQRDLPRAVALRGPRLIGGTLLGLDGERVAVALRAQRSQVQCRGTRVVGN